MRLERLELHAFRNYAAADVVFHPERNVIVGENAQGKTNLLEAVAFLSRGVSPRTRKDRELIHFDSDGASLLADIRSRERDFHTEIALFRDRRRKITVNRVAAKSAAALSGILRTVFFQPEDLSLIREGAAARRRFLDTALCQLRPAYAQALDAYQRALAQKTRILRDRRDYPGLLKTLPEFNRQMAEYGAVLVRYRHAFTLRLREYAAAFHRDCSGGREALDIRYRTVSTEIDAMASKKAVAAILLRDMERHGEAEKAAGRCLFGPHRDDLEIAIGGRDARTYASQGQARTAALSMKLAERELYRNAAGEYPALLLDDVLSELDPKRQEFILNHTGQGQVFLTCCEEDRLSRLLGGSVFHVRNGELSAHG